MKNKMPNNVKQLLVIGAFAILSIAAKAQGQGNIPQWNINGNSNIDTGKFVGTTNFNDVIIKTNSQERMRFSADGNIKANGFLVVDSMRVIGPFKIGLHSLTIGGTFAGIGTPDEITSDAGVINFGNTNSPFSNIKVNVGYNTAGTATFAVNGNAGIGTTNPNQMLTVEAGNINVNTTTSGYMIGNDYVLRNKGSVTNIYVGIGAGSTATGINNTLVGFNAGLGIANTGSSNTFIGAKSGLYNGSGSSNTMVGVISGFNNGSGNGNVLVGNVAGYLNVGNYNTYIGYNTQATGNIQQQIILILLL